MRDPKRINETLEKLRVLWELNPDLRFFQLISWVADQGWEYEDPFFWEEDRWNKLIQEQIINCLATRG
jgi:uncharacterized protein YihD (DUF1040 family)